MISADFRRNPQADWGLFFSDLNRILEKDKGLQEFKAELGEEEKLRQFKNVLNALLAQKVKCKAKEEEARRTNAWLAEEERKSSERLRQQQQREQQWRPTTTAATPAATTSDGNNSDGIRRPGS